MRGSRQRPHHSVRAPLRSRRGAWPTSRRRILWTGRPTVWYDNIMDSGVRLGGCHPGGSGVLGVDSEVGQGVIQYVEPRNVEGKGYHVRALTVPSASLLVRIQLGAQLFRTGLPRESRRGRVAGSRPWSTPGGGGGPGRRNVSGDDGSRCSIEVLCRCGWSRRAGSRGREGCCGGLPAGYRNSQRRGVTDLFGVPVRLQEDDECRESKEMVVCQEGAKEEASCRKSCWELEERDG